MASLKQMRESIVDVLLREGGKAADLPSNPAIYAELNAAKNRIVAYMEARSPNRFVERVDRTVSSGDASVALPSSYRRVLRVSEVRSNGDEWDVRVYDPHSDERRDSEPGYWFEWEGESLYFSGVAGAPRDLTLRIRYAVVIADLDGSDGDATFDRLPAEWHTVIEADAKVALLPSAGFGGNKWARIRDQTLAAITAAWTRADNSRPLAVGMRPGVPTRPVRDVRYEVT